jgi:kynureninase
VESRDALAARDAADPLSSLRDEFVLATGDEIYLMGNSLGRMPRASLDRLTGAAKEEWGHEVVDAWAHWVDLPTAVGDRLGEITLGAAPGQVLVADNTSVNIYKLLNAALAARPGRRAIIASADEFPTDRYIIEGVAAAHDLEVRWLTPHAIVGPTAAEVAERADADVACVLLSYVHFRSSAIADMQAITDAVHAVGALAIWDVSHAVGAVPVALDAHDVDLAVGCTYKYLNAGPGAPAFVYVRRALQADLTQPIWGWFGQRAQFGMGPRYDPEPDVRRFLTGTPSILGLHAVDEGLRVLGAAGIDRLRVRSTELTALLVALADEWLVPLGFLVGSPRDDSQRGGHVSLRRDDAPALVPRLRERGVVTDFREPDSVRMCPAAAYTSRVEVYDALARLRDLVASG